MSGTSHIFRKGKVVKFFARPVSADRDIAGQARVDAIVAAARSNAPVAVKRPLYREPTADVLLPSTAVIDTRLSEEIAYARRTIEAMGDTLCDDPIFLARHQVTLQTVDLLAQILGHVATVVGSADKEEAIARIGMVELRNRLARPARGMSDAGIGLHRSDRNPFATQ